MISAARRIRPNRYPGLSEASEIQVEEVLRGKPVSVVSSRQGAFKDAPARSANTIGSIHSNLRSRWYDVLVLRAPVCVPKSGQTHGSAPTETLAITLR